MMKAEPAGTTAHDLVVKFRISGRPVVSGIGPTRVVLAPAFRATLVAPAADRMSAKMRNGVVPAAIILLSPDAEKLIGATDKSSICCAPRLTASAVICGRRRGPCRAHASFCCRLLDGRGQRSPGYSDLFSDLLW